MIEKKQHGNKGKKFSKDSIKRRAITRRKNGWFKNPEKTLRIMSESKIGEKNPMKNPDTAKKCGESNKGHKKPINAYSFPKGNTYSVGIRKTERWFDIMKERMIGENNPMYGIRMLEENHWNWKGGLTSINLRIRRQLENKYWRNSVFKRDNFTCQLCKIRGGNLEAHHIKIFSKYPELRFDLDNGITLCSSCHNKTKSKEELYEKIFQEEVLNKLKDFTNLK